MEARILDFTPSIISDNGNIQGTCYVTGVVSVWVNVCSKQITSDFLTFDMNYVSTE